MLTCLPQESLLLFKDVYAVLMKMLINVEDTPGEGEASQGVGVERTLGVVDERGECGSEVCFNKKPSWKRRQKVCILRSRRTEACTDTAMSLFILPHRNPRGLYLGNVVVFSLRRQVLEERECLRDQPVL